MKQTKSKKKRKRVQVRIKQKETPLKLFGMNCAGLKSKLDSFDDILKRVGAHIWTLQETKLKQNEKLKCEMASKYQIYYLSRKDLQGGGLAIGIDKDIESTLVREGNDVVETLVVQIVIEKLPIRIVVAYGPQENDTKERKEEFWRFLEEEATKAELLGYGFMVQMDANVHGGPKLIKDDPNEQNMNGKCFKNFLERNQYLTVANNMNICKGAITRIRNLKNNKTEKAILDFLLINGKLEPFLKKMVVDEERKFCLSNYAQFKRNKRVIKSDHNAILAEFNILVPKRKPERVELFNLRNKNCQKVFTQETEENTQLVTCLENNLPFEIQCKNWLKTFNCVLYKCFKKIRVVKKDKIKNKKVTLFEEHNKLKNETKIDILTDEMKNRINIRIAQIEEEIADEICEEFVKEIEDVLNEIGGDKQNLNGGGRRAIWEILKRKYPKNTIVVPVGKKDRAGNIVTNHNGLKHLYLETYVHRLRSRPIKEEFENMKAYKDELFELRMELASSNKSNPWTLDELEIVLKQLKEGKSRDPNGWVRDLFKIEVAGSQLKKSLLILMNRMKSENYIPAFIRNADVTTIYKGKGDKFDLENDRGIFLVTTFRSILMKLIYLDKYNIIEENMSDSQIGGRKGKNVRNHVWVLHGIINDVLSRKHKHPIDIQVFDYKQCFDSLWMKECLSDIYTSGVKDDKLALLYNINNHVKIAVRTPVGKTNRKDLFNVITQGDVFAPILCSNQVDTFGKECLEQNKYNYSYKGEVDIPPLGMVDDLICVTECGPSSSMMNGYINCKTNSKKLMFGVQKCTKLHVGSKKLQFKCQDLFVDNWTEVAVEENTEPVKFKDIFEGENKIEEKESEKYLGDVLSVDGKNIRNIKTRVNKGTGVVNKIITVLEGIPFGKQYFKIGMILRDSLLVSSMLFNSEAWYNVTNKELELLESTDLSLLRQLLKAPKGTPKEMFYLELGIIPFRDIMIGRRLNFLHTILNEDPKSLIHRFFQAQCKQKTKKDWVTMVENDLEYLELNHLCFETIRNMKKLTFRNLVKKKIEDKTLKKLENLKKNHSKVKHLEHNAMVMQKYLQPNSVKMSKADAQLIFKLRCQVTQAKFNLKGKYDKLECRACKIEEETQKHIVECKVLSKEKEKVEYEKIYEGTVIEKLIIARKFQKNYEILEEEFG